MADRRALGSLATNPDLDRWVVDRLGRHEVTAALGPHRCRCGSQPRILDAAMDVLGG